MDDFILNLSLACAIWGALLLTRGLWELLFSLRVHRVGGLLHWRLSYRGRAVIGGSFYRPRRA
jgi:hypothetical protein